MSPLDKLMNTVDETLIHQLIGSVDTLAKSNEKLAESTEKEVDAMKSEYKDLRSIVETQAKQQTESINKLTNSMHEMSKSISSYALKSQHANQEVKQENTYIKEELGEAKRDIDSLNGRLLIQHGEDNQRDIAISNLQKDVVTLGDKIDDGMKSLGEKIDKKGSFFRENWHKLLTAAALLIPLIAMFAITINKSEENTNKLNSVQTIEGK